MPNIQRENPKVSNLELVPYWGKFMIGFSVTNFHNKPVIFTGGEMGYIDTKAVAYALEVDRGKWKARDTFPVLNTRRRYHGSCVLKDRVYVIGG